jgi:hypothetical protein
MSLAGRMVGLMGSFITPVGARRSQASRALRLARIAREHRLEAEAWPAFDETQPMCFEARCTEPAAQEPRSTAPR